MFELLHSVLQFFADVWWTTRNALQLNPEMRQIIGTDLRSTYVVATVAMLAGASLLLGQSIILFLNHVSPRRFVISLVVNGIIFAIEFMIWAASIWLVGLFLFEVTPSLGTVLRLVALGSAPFVFGFLVLIPYLGTFFARALYVWSFLIILVIVQSTFEVRLVSALLCVGLGWLLMLLMSSTVGKPIVALRRWLWRRVVGPTRYDNAQDMLAILVQDAQEKVALENAPHTSKQTIRHM